MRALYKILRRVRPSQLAVVVKTLLRIKRRVVTTSAGHRFSIDPVSHFGGEIMETGTYEPVLTQLMTTLLRPGDVYLDVGANEGYFSIVGAERVGKSGKVFAIEPQSRLVPVLQENFRLNDAANVTLLHGALSEREGQAVLHLASSINSGASSFYRHWKIGAGMESVSTTTLDDFFQSRGIQRARLIKIDCEGAELSIVDGARRVLEEKRADFISVDFHIGISCKGAHTKIDSQIRKSGYCLSRAGTGIWIYHLPHLKEALLPLGIPTAIAPLAA